MDDAAGRNLTVISVWALESIENRLCVLLSRRRQLEDRAASRTCIVASARASARSGLAIERAALVEQTAGWPYAVVSALKAIKNRFSIVTPLGILRRAARGRNGLTLRSLPSGVSCHRTIGFCAAPPQPAKHSCSSANK